MTEKHYGGTSKFSKKEKPSNKNKIKNDSIKTEKQIKDQTQSNSMKTKEIEKIIQAGKICSEVKQYVKSIIEKDISLLELAEKIEEKIISLGGKPAFPTNLSINEIAAHSTPSFNDETKARGLLKVDFGVHIDGFVADNAFSIDLEDSKENKNLIEAAENSRDAAIKEIKLGLEINKIGAIIEEICKKFKTEPIRNLSGHSIEQYNLHSGLTIPNFDNNSQIKIEEGLYAIEPFTTTESGSGSIKEGRQSGIYSVQKESGNVRDLAAREVLQFIFEEYSTLPFCSRWIYKKFGSRGLLALRQIEQSGILHQYPQLIEKNGKNVAQAEHTVLLTKKEKIITTL